VQTVGSVWAACRPPLSTVCAHGCPQGNRPQPERSERGACSSASALLLYRFWALLYRFWALLYRFWALLFRFWALLFRFWALLFRFWALLFRFWAGLRVVGKIALEALLDADIETEPRKAEASGA